MRFLIQRVTSAKVDVEGKTVGSIGPGFLVFIGVCATDSREIAVAMVRKLLGLRIFRDENGKTNLSLSDTNGSLLLISQFTLYADCHHGNRPSFINAGDPGLAERLYQYIIDLCSAEIPNVQTGIFGADMAVSIENQGPFTIMLDSDEIIRKKPQA